jgi:hypothetical protein
LIWAAASTAFAAGQRLNSQEWGFSVAFPERLHVCQNGSWHQAHGWGAPLAGTCEKPRTQRAIAVIANGSSLSRPEDMTGCAKLEIQAGAKLGLAFEGRDSVTCREDQPDGTVLITVATQVDLDRDADHSHLDDAAITYEAELTTTPAELMDDLVTFRSVLRTVRINRPAPNGVR